MAGGLVTEVLVPTRTGVLAGTKGDRYFAFLGVPFAQPPAGPRAFLPPAELPRSDELVACAEYGATAPQVPARSIVPLPVIEGTNYLNLNIWTPTLSADGLPVFVWIHGGGYNWGCNASPWYDGRSFARDGVVFVAVNYRFGPEGFLFLGRSNVNRGLLDNLAALTWINENIPAFGGDPGRITIGGQSSGARSCLSLYASRQALGLFRRTASMSAGAAPPKPLADAERLARDYAAEAGVDLTADGIASIPRARRLIMDQRYASLPDDRPPWQEIIRHYGKDATRWSHTQDGEIVRDSSYIEALSARGNGEALLIGTTAEENTTSVAGQVPGMSQDELRAALSVFGLGTDEAQRYLSLAGKWASAGLAFGQAITDWHYRVPVMRAADNAASTGMPVYKYEFRWLARERRFVSSSSRHGADILFVFDNLAADETEHQLGTDPPQMLADEMHSAWVRFVNGTDPWAPYTSSSSATMVFDTGSGVHRDVESTLEAVWHGLDGAP